MPSLHGTLLTDPCHPTYSLCGSPFATTCVSQDNILGIRYGLRGFYERDFKPITLTRRVVDGVHLKGGTLLVRKGGGCLCPKQCLL